MFNWTRRYIALTNSANRNQYISTKSHTRAGQNSTTRTSTCSRKQTVVSSKRTKARWKVLRSICVFISDCNTFFIAFYYAGPIEVHTLSGFPFYPTSQHLIAGRSKHLSDDGNSCCKTSLYIATGPQINFDELFSFKQKHVTFDPNFSASYALPCSYLVSLKGDIFPRWEPGQQKRLWDKV